MIDNTSFLPDITNFDSSVPETAVQYEDVNSNYFSIEDQSEIVGNQFLVDLFDQNILSKDNYFKEYKLEVYVDFEGESEHNLINYDCFAIAQASYFYSIKDSVGIIRGVYIPVSKLRLNGFGVKMKRRLDNHLKQDGSIKSYTLIVSEEGEELARKTGYTPCSVSYSLDSGKIWSKNF